MRVLLPKHLTQTASEAGSKVVLVQNEVLFDDNILLHWSFLSYNITLEEDSETLPCGLLSEDSPLQPLGWKSTKKEHKKINRIEKVS